MFIRHLPIIQIMLPLLAAPLCLLFANRPKIVWALALASAAGAALVAGFLLHAALEGGTISYLLGGFPAPLGIEYRIDAANAILLLLINVIGALALLYARPSVDYEVSPPMRPYFYICFLLCLGGLSGVAATADVFNLFVFLEISSLSAYALIAFGGGRERRAYVAAYDYLIMGTIGATFYVLGVGFLYAATGTLNMPDMAERLAAIPETSSSVRAGYAFIITGLALKIALFPLHLWLPNAYSYAPSAAAVLLAAAGTKTALYALARILFGVFGVDFTFGGELLEYLIAPLAAAGMIITSLIALRQNELKQLLAYSSIAQISYIVLGISLESRAGLEAAFLHIFNHAIIKAALFMGAGCLALRLARSSPVMLADLAALRRSMPWTLGAITLASLSLGGVPLTAGFLSKWALLIAALEKGWWLVAAAFIIASLIGAVYVWRIIYSAWFAESRRLPQENPPQEAPAIMLVPLWLMALAAIYFGWHSALPVSGALLAVDALINGAALP